MSAAAGSGLEVTADALRRGQLGARIVTMLCEEEGGVLTAAVIATAAELLLMVSELGGEEIEAVVAATAVLAVELKEREVAHARRRGIDA